MAEMSLAINIIERNKEERKEKQCTCMECLQIKQEYNKLTKLVKKLNLNADLILNLR